MGQEQSSSSAGASADASKAQLTQKTGTTVRQGKTGNALTALRKQIQVCEAQAKKYEVQSEKRKANAKAAMKQGKKKKALFELKMSKTLMSKADKKRDVMMNLETQAFAIESGMDAQQTFGAMQQGVEASKQLQSQLDQDKVADTMEQIEEGIAEQEEISNALAQPVGEPMDEDELEADLAELMGAGEQSAVRGEARAAKQPGQGVLGGAAADALPEAPTGDVLPAAPTGDLDVSEQEALKELQAELGM